jgi:AraC-like DNA-binding protein
MTLPCTALAGPRRDPSWWRQARPFLRGPAQVLHACASSSALTAASLSVADRRVIGRQLVELIEMTLHAEKLDAIPDVKEERRLAILAFIDTHLDDRDLGVVAIARAFDMSTRSVHKLFEGEPLTVARAIWERRLERCRDEMVDPALTARSITQIAHFWGFSDSQHFSRAFRQRFGMSPRDYRNIFSLH